MSAEHPGNDSGDSFTNTSSRPVLSMFLWQLLVMVWRSLWFDDALHSYIAASEFLHQPGKYKNGIIWCDNQKQEEQVKKQLPHSSRCWGRLSVQWPVQLKHMWQLLICQFPTPLHTFHSIIHGQRLSESDRLALLLVLCRHGDSSPADGLPQWEHNCAAPPRSRCCVLRSNQAKQFVTPHFRSHPFREYPKLEADLSRAVRFAARPVKAIRRKRLAIFGHWRDRAVALLPQSVKMLSSTPGAKVRNDFFRDLPPERTPRL